MDKLFSNCQDLKICGINNIKIKNIFYKIYNYNVFNFITEQLTKVKWR